MIRGTVEGEKRDVPRWRSVRACFVTKVRSLSIISTRRR